MLLSKEEFIRLRCLQLVMTVGSELDRQNPTNKAQGLYDWVTGKTTTEFPKPAEASDDLEEGLGQPPGTPSKEDLKRSGKTPKK